MATYKVLQDIEAEDKILGPLTLKQFIFAIIAIAIGFVEFQLITASALGPLRILLALVFLPPLLIFGFLAAPIGRDQPNDVWLLARLRYLIKPHKRVWNQDGMSQLVTITAPVKENKQLTNNLSATEVKSRLQALANTLDSRGWAIKNIDATTYKQADFLRNNSDSDRLIAPETIMPAYANPDSEANDMLDPNTNPAAQQLDKLVETSTSAHRQQALQAMQQPQGSTTTPADYWFLQGASNSPQGAVVQPDPQAVLPVADQPLPTITSTHNPAINKVPTAPPQTDTKTPTTPHNPAILELAHNDDLNVATIARQAQRLDESNGEVVVSLH